MARGGSLRGVTAIVVVAGLVALGLIVARWGHDSASEFGPGPNGSTEVRGPVPWKLLGVGADGKSVIVLPLESTGGCRYGWATAKIPSPTIQIRASLRRKNCESETADLRSASPITVPIPGPEAWINGRRIDGPKYEGVGTREQILSASGPGHRVAVPNVEGLRLDVARQILQRIGADVETAGPTGETASVQLQWPAPGTPIDVIRDRSDPTLRAGPIPDSLLLTSSSRPEDRKVDDERLTCATVRRHRIPDDDLEVFGRLVPRACRPASTRSLSDDFGALRVSSFLTPSGRTLRLVIASPRPLRATPAGSKRIDVRVGKDRYDAASQPKRGKWGDWCYVFTWHDAGTRQRLKSPRRDQIRVTYRVRGHLQARETKGFWPLETADDREHFRRVFGCGSRL